MFRALTAFRAFAVVPRTTSVSAFSVARAFCSSRNEIPGMVKWFDEKKGFGFVTPDDAEGTKDVFVHFSAIRTNQPFKTLKDGERVRFTVEETSRGPQAYEVWPEDEQH
eukprot:CAMPEP_0171451600 /NCGR_PEP_ID=MMETSP0945-20130129/43_1 /TAXON_ID=109269 /ORGANISM="Vaucheria litorea, Strain CCMP2940" /LENGTH=108 /DNA_ID=CAMNT_0011976099 /DNA_START=95 /DNA_END=421 /DNA_ORIENTATION=-